MRPGESFKMRNCTVCTAIISGHRVYKLRKISFTLCVQFVKESMEISKYRTGAEFG